MFFFIVFLLSYRIALIIIPVGIKSSLWLFQMKKLFVLGVIFLSHFVVANNAVFAQNKVDFKTINIAGKVWMSENLNIEKFRNGELIPQAKTSKEWEEAANNRQAAWCYYDFDSTKGLIYGKLYNWYAVDDKRGLAPEGWHISSTQDWDVLAKATGGTSYAGTRLKSSNGWIENGNGNNHSGFGALPGGFCTKFGKFYELKEGGYWWTSQAADNWWGIYRNLSYRTSILVESHYHEMTDGFSVRCVKD